MIAIVSDIFTLTVDAGEWTDSTGGRWLAIARDIIERAEAAGTIPSNPVDPDPDLTCATLVAESLGANLEISPDRKAPRAIPGVAY